jgi:predicted nucleotidyltransferase
MNDMSNLVVIDFQIVYEKVLPILKEYQEISGAIHFGSSLGKCRPDSDIDIGLICRPSFLKQEKNKEKLIEKILNQLPPVNGHAFDVVVVNTLPSILAFKIVKEGNIFYKNEPGVITDFFEQVSRRYGEDYPRYFTALQMVVGV